MFIFWTIPFICRGCLTSNEDYTLYVSLYVHRRNANLKKLISAFYELVKNNMYPPEE